VAPGAKAVLVVRPERIALAPSGQAALQGEVRGTMYSGSDLMLHCVLADGTSLRMRLAGAVDVASLHGQVGFLIPNDALRAFPA
jgi:ABC-type Fe3+/spermidine/putrescine transport system ATPase subunit